MRRLRLARPRGDPGTSPDRGAHSAESVAAAGRRPSNLIWVMPAQGVRSTSSRAMSDPGRGVRLLLVPRLPGGNVMENRRWRTVDIVVAAVIAVAFGVVFYAWDQLWGGIDTAFGGF